RHAQRRALVGAEKGGTLQHEERTQPLAAVEHAVAHGSEQPRRPRYLAGFDALAEQPLEQRFDRAGADFQNGLEGGGLVHNATVYGKVMWGQARKTGCGHVAYRPAQHYAKLTGRMVRDRTDLRDGDQRIGHGVEAKGSVALFRPGMGATVAAPRDQDGCDPDAPADRADHPLSAALRASGLDADDEGPCHLPGLRPAL